MAQINIPLQLEKLEKNSAELQVIEATLTTLSKIILSSVS